MTRITRFALRYKAFVVLFWLAAAVAGGKIGRASCRERV